MVVQEYYYEPEIIMHFLDEGTARDEDALQEEGTLYSTILFGPFDSIQQASRWQDNFLVMCCNIFGGKIIELISDPQTQTQKTSLLSMRKNTSPSHRVQKTIHFKKRLQSASLIIKSRKPFKANQHDFFDNFEISQPCFPDEKNLKEFVQHLPAYLSNKQDVAFAEATRRFRMGHEQQRLSH